MMDVLMSETCWTHKKWNKIASYIKLVFYSSTIRKDARSNKHKINCIFTLYISREMGYSSIYKASTSQHSTCNINLLIDSDRFSEFLSFHQGFYTNLFKTWRVWYNYITEIQCTIMISLLYLYKQSRVSAVTVPFIVLCSCSLCKR